MYQKQALCTTSQTNLNTFLGQITGKGARQIGQRLVTSVVFRPFRGQSPSRCTQIPEGDHCRPGAPQRAAGAPTGAADARRFEVHPPSLQRAGAALLWA